MKWERTWTGAHQSQRCGQGKEKHIFKCVIVKGTQAALAKKH
jgi:hypothetical protein